MTDTIETKISKKPAFVAYVPPQKIMPTFMRLGFDDWEIDQLPLALLDDAVNTERHAPLHLAHQAGCAYSLHPAANNDTHR